MSELKDLVIMKDGQAVTTSLEVAKIFEKRHDRVIRAIESKLTDPNFGVSEMFYCCYMFVVITTLATKLLFSGDELQTKKHHRVKTTMLKYFYADIELLCLFRTI